MTTPITSKNLYHEYQWIRDLRSYKWKDSVLEKLPASFCRFAEEHLLANIPPQRQKWLDKQRLLCGLLYLLIVTGLHGKTVIDSRSTSKAEVRKRIKLWKLLIQFGWAKMVLGHRLLKYETRYFATSELLQQIPGFESDIFPEQQLIRNPKIPGTTPPESLVFAVTRGAICLPSQCPNQSAARSPLMANPRLSWTNPHPPEPDTPPPSKMCTDCCRTQPLTDFRFRSKAAGTRMHQCNACHAQRERERQEIKRAKEAGWAIHKTASQIARSRNLIRSLYLLDHLIDAMGGRQNLVDRWRAECHRLSRQRRSSTRLARMYEMLISLACQVRGMPWKG